MFVLFIFVSLQVLHKLDIVEDDILSEQNFGLFECQDVVEHHIPANRGYGSINISCPFYGNSFQILLLSYYRGLLYVLIQGDLDLHLASIAVRLYIRD